MASFRATWRVPSPLPGRILTSSSRMVCSRMAAHLPGAQTGRRGGAGPAGGSLGGKGPAGRLRSRPLGVRAIATSLLDLSGAPEPLLILGRLLPALVGGAGADQVDVGAEVLAVLAGP